MVVDDTVDDTTHVYIIVYMFFHNISFFGDLGSENIKKGPELVGHGPRHLRSTFVAHEYLLFTKTP